MERPAVYGGSMPTTPGRFPWARLAPLCLAVMLTVSAETLPAGVMPAMAADLGVPETAIGTLVAVWGLTVILTSIPLVRLLARADRRAVVGIALTGMAAGNLATALAPDYAAAFASRLVGATFHGVFWAMVVVYASSLLRPAHLAAGIAIVTGGSQLAAALAIPAAAAAVEVVSWRWICAAVSIAALGIAAVILRALPSDPADPPAAADVRAARPAPGRRAAGRLATPLLLSAAALLFVFGHFVVYTYITRFLTQVSGVDDARQGLLLGIIGVASIAGLVFSGPVTNRWPSRGPIVLFALFAAAMVLVGTAGTRLGLLAAGLALWGLMFGTIGPTVQALALHATPPAHRAFVSAAMVVAFNLGISSGSWAGGLVLGATSSPALSPFVAAVALTAGAGLAVVVAVRRPRQA
ncbi:MFS transporter [Pseudactinotalea sp. HY160]|nr:MFS transporter [Pseudactinotalea sp. HY160]